MAAIHTWTVAQCLLFPQDPPDSPAIGRAGIVSVTKVPGFLDWTVTVSEAIGPEAILILGVVSDPALAIGGVRSHPVPFPPSAPASTVRVYVVAPDGLTVVPNGFAVVQFRVDRQSPLEQTT